jgi:hypothetical protein
MRFFSFLRSIARGFGVFVTVLFLPPSLSYYLSVSSMIKQMFSSRLPNRQIVSPHECSTMFIC